MHPVESPSLQHLPAPPAAMHRIVEAASDGRVPLRSLAKLVATEPSFTVELLRLANSPYYGVAREVRTAQQATLALGVRAVRNHAVSHVVRVLADRLSLEHFDGSLFWEDSLRRAVLAAELARASGECPPDEAFTVGLIQDVGVLVLAASRPEAAAGLQGLRTRPAPERLRAERALHGTTHAMVFGSLAAQWGIPADLAEAVRAHHHEDLSPASCLTRVAAAADAVADVYATTADPVAVRRARALLDALDAPLTLEDLGAVVEERLPEMGRQLRIRTRTQPDLGEILAEANRSLVSIAHDYEALTQRLERLLEERDELTRMLERANKELRRLAATDELTGVANRRRFMAVATEALERAWRVGTPLSLVIFDLDHFKDVNDSHGHQVGDDVLQIACRRIAGLLRETDLIGRVGGEEFAVLLPATDAAGGLVVSRRCQRLLAAHPCVCRGGAEVRVTASFGGATVCFDHPREDLSELFNRSDTALYEAKGAGRNQVSWSD